MDPHTQRTPASRIVRATRTTALLAFGAAVALLAFATPVNATTEHVDICHKTGNGYNLISPSEQGVVSGHIGASHHNGLDVVPPFEFEGTTYSQNWDAEGMALFENDCVEPDEECTQDCPSETTTPTSTSTPTGEVPFFTSGTTLLLGVGGALAGTLMMLRRRL